jgi:hypothetical protein
MSRYDNEECNEPLVYYEIRVVPRVFVPLTGGEGFFAFFFRTEQTGRITEGGNEHA